MNERKNWEGSGAILTKIQGLGKEAGLGLMGKSELHSKHIKLWGTLEMFK